MAAQFNSGRGRVNNLESDERVIDAYETAITRYKALKERGVLPTDRCSCILGNDTEDVTASIIDCPEHG
jgi:hypothetical protein